MFEFPTICGTLGKDRWDRKGTIPHPTTAHGHREISLRSQRAVQARAGVDQTSGQSRVGKADSRCQSRAGKANGRG